MTKRTFRQSPGLRPGVKKPLSRKDLGAFLLYAVRELLRLRIGKLALIFGFALSIIGASSL